MAPVKLHTPALLDTPEATARFLREISATREIAVDTEGASFHRFVDRIYLLQVSTRDRTAIIDPLAVAQLDGLGALMERDDVEVVFHDADYDLRLLRQDYGWDVVRIFDTRIAAQMLGIRAFGLAALLERYFDVKLEKKYQRADWSLRPLTSGMREYAAQDTMYLLPLRDRMRDELRERRRLSWAEEEFAVVQHVHWTPDEPTTAFLRVKGARDLDRRELAVLRELVLWRDGLAAELDRAMFRVVGNEALLEVARRRPRETRGLTAIKGMPRAIVQRHAGEMFDAIARGLAVPDADLPRFPKARRWDRDPDFDARVSALKTARDTVARQLEMDPGVVCAKDRIEAVARRNPATADELKDVAELRNWQRDILADAFLAALATHRSGAHA